MPTDDECSHGPPSIGTRFRAKMTEYLELDQGNARNWLFALREATAWALDELERGPVVGSVGLRNREG